ncbi:magnesium-translocating P-type ATPase [Estrella lausannensis]|uniref:magnesium-translocating P-type ATPase n=1 Tax=Estrella lausannensis TaxID=483423 RepID=UPI001EF58FA9|nr:magnesium-translocating P-type ATPase [Estrella lausannensis]
MDSKSAGAFWSFSPDQVIAFSKANPKDGLSDIEAQRRLRRFGKNVIQKKTRTGNFWLFLKQLDNPLIFILLTCVILSLILYDSSDALIILAIIAISCVLSFFQEKRALGAMEKLLHMIKIKTTVIRDSEVREVPVDHVVPGDLIQLGAGDMIPGDCYILECKDLFVDEAALTGETFLSEKSPGVLAADITISKRSNALFMGTHVVSGTAKVLVVRTGLETEFGEISGRLSKQPPETEFERGIRQFSFLLLKVTVVILISIFALNIYQQRPLMESLLFSLALAVGLTPQLLPAIISINLAKGAERMAKSKVIVKRLSSIEDLGSMDILCCDKTGTLTSGDIKLNGAYDLSGSSSQKVSLLAYLNAHFQTGYSNPIDKAILQFSSPDINQWIKLDEIPYSFHRKRLSILLKNGSESWIVTKGAFEQVLSLCTKAETAEGKEVDITMCSNELKRLYEEYSGKGFRIIGISYRLEKDLRTIDTEDDCGMTFAGFLIFSDTPKPHVYENIEELRKLGIGLRIITGDSKQAAIHLARVLKIPEGSILTGTEMLKMSDRALVGQVKQKCIFAEIEPNQKEQIVLALKNAGHVVGYLGDGINDVTALHSADVSIAVDTGADVAKDVADIVLLEKDLSVLQKGVKSGRVTFANTLKYIFMAASANFGNMFSMAGVSLFIDFLPLLPKQILLTNLMEDLPEMMIATDHVDEERVQSPLKCDIAFIRKFMITFGLISSLFDYATFGMLIWLNASVEEFRTGWFVESVVSAALIVLIARTFRPFYQSHPSRGLMLAVFSVIAFTFILPYTLLAPYLGFTPLPMRLNIFVFVLIILYALAVEWAKKRFLLRWLAEAGKAPETV